jgi:cytochrome c oxidase subunit 2
MGERWERGEQWGNTNRGYGQAIIWLLLIVGGVSCAEAPGDVDIPNALNPAGPAAGEIATLWWVMFGLGTFVFVLVLGIMLYTVLADRRHDEDAVEEALVDEETGRRWLWLGGVALPAVILPIVLFFNLRTLAAVDQPPQPAVVNIEVVGHRWWWEVRYPDEGFTTANEIHVPVGQPVNIQLTSRDVIHSFWVPELHGKRDLNPGDTNTFWLQADEPGEYRGLCAEFCGEQHARTVPELGAAATTTRPRTYRRSDAARTAGFPGLGLCLLSHRARYQRHRRPGARPHAFGQPPHAGSRYRRQQSWQPRRLDSGSAAYQARQPDAANQLARQRLPAPA